MKMIHHVLICEKNHSATSLFDSHKNYLSEDSNSSSVTDKSSSETDESNTDSDEFDAPQGKYPNVGDNCPRHLTLNSTLSRI